jgi:hypothetical protein
MVGGGVKIILVSAPLLMRPDFSVGVTRTWPPSLEDAAEAVDIDDGISWAACCWAPRALKVAPVAEDPTSEAAFSFGAIRGGSGVRGATYPPIGPPVDDDDGVRKTGSPSGERPFESAPEDAPELDIPRP